MNTAEKENKRIRHHIKSGPFHTISKGKDDLFQATFFSGVRDMLVSGRVALNILNSLKGPKGENLKDGRAMF